MNSLEELLEVIRETRENFGYDKPILIEEFLTELPIIEEDYSQLSSNLPRICGYEAKWFSGSPYGKIRSIKAELPEEVKGVHH